MISPASQPLRLYSTCPQSKDIPAADYLGTVIAHTRWSDDAGFAGMLVYTDNGIVDPWPVAQVVLQNSRRLRPLVAVQPIYRPPYTAAKMVATFGLLHGRGVALNMLAGGFRNDLVALGDTTPHDDRYVRTTEYTLILRRLLDDSGPVSFAGRYYTVNNLTLTPALPRELLPDILISGSSDAGMKAAQDIGAVAVRYPRPPEEEDDADQRYDVPCGIRVGIISRHDAGEAWRIAQARFPDDRKGAIRHRLAMTVSDSAWHQQLSTLGERAASETPYWLGPFQRSQTFCPYLVGAYDTVAAELARYMTKGYRSFILDIVPSAEEFAHIKTVFDKALERAA
ncbi:MAG TPA: LLM class flavin-dependent oxidoreductase [Azospirillaceae bacterium]|nr:LLM class flavin-dependent oxidoreductase [Azospirillaceae bacterium]